MGGDTVTQIIYNLCDWLSGNLAIGIAILAVTWSGYEMLKGRIDKGSLLIRSISIGVIIGASYIAKTYLLKGVAS